MCVTQQKTHMDGKVSYNEEDKLSVCTAGRGQTAVNMLAN